jgi:hypothetical protein
VSAAGTEVQIDYAEGSELTSIEASDNLTFINNSGVNTGTGSYSADYIS